MKEGTYHLVFSILVVDIIPSVYFLLTLSFHLTEKKQLLIEQMSVLILLNSLMKMKCQKHFYNYKTEWEWAGGLKGWPIVRGISLLNVNQTSAQQPAEWLIGACDSWEVM